MNPSNSSTESSLLEAKAHHRAGRLTEAEEGYARILTTQPMQDDAIFNLGKLERQRGQLERALEYFKAALEIRASESRYWLCYIETLIAAGLPDVARLAIGKGWLNRLHGLGMEAAASQLAIALRGYKTHLTSLNKNITLPQPAEMQHLVGLLKHGCFMEVESISRAMTKLFPQHAFGWQMLGASLVQMERADEALDPLEKVTLLLPYSHEAHSNLGAALKSVYKFDEAMSSLKRALTIKSDYVNALFNLGSLYKEQKKYDKALECYRHVSALKPDHAECYLNIASITFIQGQIHTAETMCRHAIELRPNFISAHTLMSQILLNLGLSETAIRHINIAEDLQKEYANALNRYAHILHEQHRNGEAILALKQALEYRANDAEIEFNLGNMYVEQDNLELAVTFYNRAIQHRPDYPEAHNNLANAQKELGQISESEGNYQKALELNSEYAEAYNNYGALLMEIGKSDAAEALFRKALLKKPSFSEPLFHLSILKHLSQNDPDFWLLHDKFNQQDIAINDKIQLGYALGKAHADIGTDIELSFSYYATAASLKRSQIDYDIELDEQLFNSIRNHFNPSIFGTIAEPVVDKHTPVFIVGMPRSGTSLIEQILASHPQVHACGELTMLDRLVRSLSRRKKISFPEWVCKESIEDFKSIGAQYTETLIKNAEKFSHHTDKMPLNFRYLGLIALIFPNARIIHVRRNALDTCLSCYTQLFTYGNEFSYDLSEIGRYYRAYDRLMTYWHSVMPKGMLLGINYEDLVCHLEPEARMLLAHCGLKWNPGCLKFHTTKRHVSTASFKQVRQPLYKSSVGRWKRFENQLGPLINALGPLVHEIDLPRWLRR